LIVQQLADQRLVIGIIFGGLAPDAAEASQIVQHQVGIVAGVEGDIRVRDFPVELEAWRRRDPNRFMQPSSIRSYTAEEDCVGRP
jgi:hypothetical protein